MSPQLREQLIASGFNPVTYDGQEGVFLAKQLLAHDMPYFCKHVVDGEYILSTNRIVVEVCPDNTVQLVDQDSDYVEYPVPIDSDDGIALLEDAGFPGKVAALAAASKR